MPIWNFNGRWNKVPWNRANLELDVYLCCPGPSLATVDPNALRVPGAFVVAMNTAYPKIRPDMWIGMDRPPCYAPSLLAESFPKVMRGGLQDVMWGGKKVCEYPQTYFADVSEAKTLDILDRLQPESKMVWRKNTFFVTINLLAWMGAKNIYLLGCDFGGSKDYYDDRVLSDEHRSRNKRLYAGILAELRPLAKDLDRAGIHLISCTPDSPINSFLKCMPLAEALKQTASRVDVTAPVLSSPNAEICTWNHKVSHEAGVVVLADKGAEWMIPWWYGRYRQYNNAPVQFVDNGMTEAGVNFCKAHGLYLSLKHRSKDMSALPGWFAKPAAILSSPFRKTVYMDLDCEVLGNVDPIINVAKDGLRAHVDVPWEQTEAFRSNFPSESGESAYNSGVIVVEHGHPSVEYWATLIAENPQCFVGDQDYLTIVNRKYKIMLLPTEFNFLRLETPWPEGMRHPEILIRHWTGPVGKTKVRAESRPADRCLDFMPHSHELFNRLVGKKALRGAEVGVFHGRTSTYLLNMIPDLHLYLVDQWISVDKDHRYAKSGDETARFSQEQMDRAAEYVAKSTEFAAFRRHIIRAPSVSAAGQVPDKSLDFVFVDADHTYEGCKEDIEAWWPKVKNGGFLSGHDLDYQPKGGNFGVRKAVEEFAEANGLLMEAGQGETWFIDKPAIETVPATVIVPADVWAVWPSVNEYEAIKCNARWQAKGYKTCVLMNGDNNPEAVNATQWIHCEAWNGFAQAANELCRHVPGSIVVVIGDDMYPINSPAADLEQRYRKDFPDLDGVVSPIGDDYGDIKTCCIAPWIGRKFIETAYKGQGPYWPEYFHYFADRELQDVATLLGKFRQWPYAQFHDHWTRKNLAKRPEHLQVAGSKWHQDHELFLTRSAAGFPGYK